MKRLFGFATILLATACVAACGSIPTTPLIPASADVVLLQASTTADAAYNTAATTYLAVGLQGFLAIDPVNGANLHAQAKALLQQARPFILAADHAEALGDATTFNAQFAQASALLTQVKALLPAAAH